MVTHFQHLKLKRLSDSPLLCLAEFQQQIWSHANLSVMLGIFLPWAGLITSFSFFHFTREAPSFTSTGFFLQAGIQNSHFYTADKLAG